MNTTELFVEIIIIGAGVITWTSFLILSLLGYRWVPWRQLLSPVMLIPFLSLTYILGIVFDRVVDKVFSKWDKKLRNREFSSTVEYHDARTFSYTYASDKIIDLFEYGKSRMRISRAWSINFILIASSALIFLWSNFPELNTNQKIRINIAIALVGIVGSILSTIAWKSLAVNDYKRLSETMNFLKREKSTG